MEKRLDAQDEIIYLLKQSSLTNIAVPSTSKQTHLSHIQKSVIPKNQPTTSTTEYSNQAHLNFHKNTDTKSPNKRLEVPKDKNQYDKNSNKISLSQVNEAVNNAMSESNMQHNIHSKLQYNERTKLNSNNNRRRPIIGSNTSSPNLAVSKQGYLHVYRLNPELEPKDLLDFLKLTAPEIKFECKELNKTERSRSFLVSFPIVHVKEVYNPNIWPNGAAVNRFKFPVNRNFSVTASAPLQI